VLTADDDADTTLGARLLADLRDVFGDADAMHGEVILGALHKISEGTVGRLLRPAPERPATWPGCSSRTASRRST